MSPQELADIRAEIERAITAGEMVRVGRRPSNVVALRPPPKPDPGQLRRQYWRWAAWACPNGVPPGFTEEERPR